MILQYHTVWDNAKFQENSLHLWFEESDHYDDEDR